MYNYVCKSCLLLMTSSMATSLLATDVNLNLQVTGTILEAPSWKDTGSNALSSVSFNFANIITGAAASNVDSAAVSVILSDPSNASSTLTVNLTTPSACTIGGNAITNSHVVLVHSSTAYANSATLSISEGATNSILLRFKSDGNYGDKSGAVSCSNAGSLTYSY